jgi:TATA-box binding protein (TBP) (component of TFIID and TFIIIB)
MERQEKSPKLEIKITNVVATTSLRHRIDLLELNKASQGWVNYRPELDPFATAYLKIPRAVIRTSSTGILICMQCKSETEARRAVKIFINYLKKLGFIIKPGKPKITIKNIVCSTDLGKKIGCGIIERVFPKAKRSRLGGESFVITSEEGTIRVFLNGKIIGLGFKNEAEAIKGIERTAELLYSAIEESDREKRAEICKIQRFDPAIEALVTHGKKLKFSEPDKEFDEVLEEAERLILRYCAKRIEDSFGHEPKGIAAGALYLAGLLKGCGRRTQKDIAEAFETTEVNVRNSYKTIAKTLGLPDSASEILDEALGKHTK